MSISTRSRATSSASAPTDRKFERTIDPLLQPLLSYFLRRVEPADDAADCVSETLVVLWQHRSRLPTEDTDVRAWSFGVAKKVLANHRRGRVRRDALSERLRDELLVATSPSEPSVDSDLATALGHLKAIDRELVMLVAWDGFGVAEAGAHLGLKPDAARARYSRARGQLRVMLSPTGP